MGLFESLCVGKQKLELGKVSSLKNQLDVLYDAFGSLPQYDGFFRRRMPVPSASYVGTDDLTLWEAEWFSFGEHLSSGTRYFDNIGFVSPKDGKEVKIVSLGQWHLNQTQGTYNQYDVNRHIRHISLQKLVSESCIEVSDKQTKGIRRIDFGEDYFDSDEAVSIILKDPNVREKINHMGEITPGADMEVLSLRHSKNPSLKLPHARKPTYFYTWQARGWQDPNTQYCIYAHLDAGLLKLWKEVAKKNVIVTAGPTYSSRLPGI
jgi:hypothetical protein